MKHISLFILGAGLLLIGHQEQDVRPIVHTIYLNSLQPSTAGELASTLDS